MAISCRCCPTLYIAKSCRTRRQRFGKHHRIEKNWAFLSQNILKQMDNLYTTHKSTTEAGKESVRKLKCAFIIFKLDTSQLAASIQTSGFCAFLERPHLQLLKYWRRILANINLTSTDEGLRRFLEP